MIVNQKEIEILRNNGLIHKEIEQEIKKIAKPGVSGYTINNLCGEICDKYGVIPGFKGVYGFPANLCISINSCVVHGVPSKKMIFKEGDVVKFDFGVKDKKIGINTDAAFTLIIGDGPYNSKIEKLLKITQEALYKGIKKAVPGNKIGDLSYAIQTYVEKNGFFIVKDLTGHGLGYSLHEKPYIPNYGKPGVGETLKENMLLAIEPIVGLTCGKIRDNGGFEIYISDGSIGAQFEHTIIVKPFYPEIIV